MSATSDGRQSDFYTLLALIFIGMLTLAFGNAKADSIKVLPHATASVISDSNPIEQGKEFRVALRLTLEKGWHTYWKNPGEAGEPARIDVQARNGVVRASPIVWPAPRYFHDQGLLSYGYEGEVILPLTVTLLHALQKPGPLMLEMHASWLICKQICIPQEGRFTLPLQVAEQGVASSWRTRFAAINVPQPYPGRAELSASGELSLRAADRLPYPVIKAWFMPYKPGVAELALPRPVAWRDGTMVLPLKVRSSPLKAEGLSGVIGLLDQRGGEHFFSINPALAEASPAPHSLLLVCGFALMGGLILNLMPCVFPVLAMKAMSFVHLSAKPRKTRMLSALSYASGVILTFAALGAATAAAVHMGRSGAGWGVQFQSPFFTLFLGWLLFFLSMNFLGFVELGLFLTRVGPGSAAAGYRGDFLAGLMAVFIASPCTAPFMGTAVAAAMGASTLTGILIFVCLGAGMASPYLLLALCPGALAFLPRPGAWMEQLRQFLAFPLLLTCVWLLWVAAQQGGPSAVAAMGGSFVAIGFCVWLWRCSYNAGRVLRFTYCGVMALTLVGMAYGSLAALGGNPPRSGGGMAVMAFSAERLHMLRQQGRPVFVNITASWCLTCLVNERVALSSASVKQAFREHNVAYLRGDWTNHDAAITAFLRHYGREGVPLYLYFPPRGEGRLLPQILTPGRVAGAISSR